MAVTQRLQVGQDPVQVFQAAPGLTAVKIVNSGNLTVWLGGPGTGLGNGYPLSPGSEETFDLATGEQLYAVRIPDDIADPPGSPVDWSAEVTAYAVSAPGTSSQALMALRSNLSPKK